MATARFTIICPECVRIEYSPAPTGRRRFLDEPSLMAMVRGDGRPDGGAFGAPVEVDDVPGGKPLHLRTARFELEFTPQGKGLTPETLRVSVHGPFAPGGPSGQSTVWTPGARQVSNLGGTLRTLDALKAPAFVPPGLLARDGWTLIDDSHGHVIVDDWVKTRAETLGKNAPGYLDWYLLCYGGEYGDALRAFAAFAGTVPMPRRSVLGSWYSRYWPHTSADFRKIVDEYDAHGVPLDVMVLDMDWHRDGWTGWSWNRKLLPDAEELLAWMHERGLAVTLNLHPADGVAPHEDRYGDFMRALGHEPASGRTIRFDAGDQRYMQALFDQVHRPLEEDGVDFWWVDWQQQEFVESVRGLTHLAWLNYLYFQHTCGPGTAGRRGQSFSRWAGRSCRPRSPGGACAADESGWADHRHPIHFSGDAHTGWPMLKYQVPFTATAGNVGCFFWSHDIGGHFGPRNEEATARWVQFGALSAALRMHSARSATLDRRPWTYAAPYSDAIRAAMRLRSHLIPYIYTQVRACYDQMLPLLRPMYIDRSRAEQAYWAPGQYMLGAHLLAAPVVEEGRGQGRVATRSVWFPPDVPEISPRFWYRWTTGERYEAGSWVVVAASINEAPLFAPGGVPIPTRPLTMRMATEPLRSAVVRLFPGEPGFVGKSELYEDDGLTRGYEVGRFSRTPLAAEWSGVEGEKRGVKVTIGPPAGMFDGQLDARSWTVELVGVEDLSEVLVNGAAATDCVLERDGHCVRIRMPERPAHAATTVEARVRLQNPDAVRLRETVSRLNQATGGQFAPRTDDELRHVIADLIAAESPNGAEPAAIALGVGVHACERWQEGNAEPERLIFADPFGSVDGGRVSVDFVDQVGNLERTALSSELTLAGTTHGRARSAVFALPNEPLKRPPLGLRATRWVRCRAAIGGRPIQLRSAVARLTPPITQWRVIGPFPWSWKESVTTQSASPESGGWGPDDRHTGTDGQQLNWVRGQSSTRWATDFATSFDGRKLPGLALGYAITHLICTRTQIAWLALDASDKLEVWVNRTKVFSMDTFDGEAAAAGGVEITLRAGRNMLLVKCASGGIAGLSGWGFTASVLGDTAMDADAGLVHEDPMPHPHLG